MSNTCNNCGLTRDSIPGGVLQEEVITGQFMNLCGPCRAMLYMGYEIGYKRCLFVERQRDPPWDKSS